MENEVNHEVTVYFEVKLVEMYGSSNFAICGRNLVLQLEKGRVTVMDMIEECQIMPFYCSVLLQELLYFCSFFPPISASSPFLSWRLCFVVQCFRRAHNL